LYLALPSLWQGSSLYLAPRFIGGYYILIRFLRGILFWTFGNLNLEFFLLICSISPNNELYNNQSSIGLPPCHSVLDTESIFNPRTCAGGILFSPAITMAGFVLIFSPLIYQGGLPLSRNTSHERRAPGHDSRTTNYELINDIRNTKCHPERSRRISTIIINH